MYQYEYRKFNSYLVDFLQRFSLETLPDGSKDPEVSEQLKKIRGRYFTSCVERPVPFESE